MRKGKGETSARKKQGEGLLIAGVVVVIIVAILGFDWFASTPAGEQILAPIDGGNSQPPAPAPPSAAPPAAAPSADRRVAVDSFNSKGISLRNVGSATLATADVRILVNGDVRTCEWTGDTVSIPALALRRCTFSGAECGGGQKIQVIGPSNSLEVVC